MKLDREWWLIASRVPYSINSSVNCIITIDHHHHQPVSPSPSPSSSLSLSLSSSHHCRLVVIVIIIIIILCSYTTSYMYIVNILGKFLYMMTHICSITLLLYNTILSIHLCKYIQRYKWLLDLLNFDRYVIQSQLPSSKNVSILRVNF